MNTRTSTPPRCICGSLVAGLHAVFCPLHCRRAARKAVAAHLLAMPSLISERPCFGGDEVR